MCQETNIGKINIIPWKAFIIKGIKASDRLRWEKLMGKFGINERHSSLELNWHLPVIDREALELKKFLVRELDQQDISTHGLTFTIKTNREMFFFTAIVIEKSSGTGSIRASITIFCMRKNFNPNNLITSHYARNVKKEIIPSLLIELSKLYFRQLNPEKEHIREVEKEAQVNGYITSYQCSNCLTIYDKKYGDPSSNIPAGVAFESCRIPTNVTCVIVQKNIFYR